MEKNYNIVCDIRDMILQKGNIRDMILQKGKTNSARLLSLNASENYTSL
jgi:hypothetical protein